MLDLMQGRLPTLVSVCVRTCVCESERCVCVGGGGGGRGVSVYTSMGMDVCLGH